MGRSTHQSVNLQIMLLLRSKEHQAKEGHFVNRNAPFGYRKFGENKDRTIIVEKREADIIRFIYDSYLSDVPLNVIKQQAYELGFDRNGNTAVEEY